MTFKKPDGGPGQLQPLVSFRRQKSSNIHAIYYLPLKSVVLRAWDGVRAGRREPPRAWESETEIRSREPLVAPCDGYRERGLHALPLTRVTESRKLRILGMGRKAQKNDSLPGSLDMLILRTLSLRDLHGYGIVQFIQQSSENELLVEEGSLYPALQRLELHGWIDGIWGVTSNNRRARIYKITATGRKQLAVETRKYAKLTLAIARVMGAE